MDQSDGILTALGAVVTAGLGLLAKALHSSSKRKRLRAGEDSDDLPLVTSPAAGYQVLFSEAERLRKEITEALSRERAENERGRARIDQLEHAVRQWERLHARAEQQIQLLEERNGELARERIRHLAELERNQHEIRRLELRVVELERDVETKTPSGDITDEMQAIGRRDR